jgi:hypothetical protein
LGNETDQQRRRPLPAKRAGAAMLNLHGSLVENLEAALESTRRLRGQRVYSDTIQFWSDLLETARRVLATVIDVNSPAVAALADQLEEELRGFLQPTEARSSSSDELDGILSHITPRSNKAQSARPVQS